MDLPMFYWPPFLRKQSGWQRAVRHQRMTPHILEIGLLVVSYCNQMEMLTTAGRRTYGAALLRQNGALIVQTVSTKSRIH